MHLVDKIRGLFAARKKEKYGQDDYYRDILRISQESHRHHVMMLAKVTCDMIKWFGEI